MIHHSITEISCVLPGDRFLSLSLYLDAHTRALYSRFRHTHPIFYETLARTRSTLNAHVVPSNRHRITHLFRAPQQNVWWPSIVRRHSTAANVCALC